NKCYKIVQDTTLNFDAASKACSDQGKEYSLVSIHSELENAFIALQLDRKSFVNVWIGFHDDSFDSTFKWLDNSPEDFTNWNTGEPSSYSEHCVEMLIPADVTGKWNDVSCSVSRGYICQTNKALRYPTQAPAVSKCPSGYTATADSCFRVVKTAKDFKDAQSACKVDGANLASINSKYEQMSIEVLAKDVPGAVWIGLKRENESHIWLDNWPYTYVKWALNEPSLNEGEYCTVLLNVEWKDTQCDLKYPAICEYNTGNPPTTPIPGKCPPDSSRFQGFCFYVDPNARVTWSQAKANCINRGMNLLSFRNIKEVEHVRQSVESKVGRYDFPLWIGMRRNRSEDESYEYFDYYPEENLGWSNNKFKWIDEPDNSFKNWNDREPSGSWGHESEECVEMKNTGKFNDINCDNYKKPYGCSGHETFDTPITTAPTAGENPSVVVSTTSSDFEVVSSKQTVSSSIIIGVSRSTTKEQSLKPKEPARVAPKIKLEPDEPNILTAGQIVGILIGTVTLLIIIIVVLLVIKHQLQKGGYVTNSAHGFTNAMYLKTVESVSVAEGTGKQSI
uniref:C-type lectin domain-containing protein n=1 Tax=Magallana gigas TaxID=29159 RepID=A0A8W8K457_MAGGI